jgi:hypothetical protein
MTALRSGLFQGLKRAVPVPFGVGDSQVHPGGYSYAARRSTCGPHDVQYFRATLHKMALSLFRPRRTEALKLTRHMGRPTNSTLRVGSLFLMTVLRFQLSPFRMVKLTFAERPRNYTLV